MKNILLNSAARLWRQFSLPSFCAACIRSSFLASAQLLFPHQANGSLLVDKSGAVRGSALLAPEFHRRAIFPSASVGGGANGYDPTSSGGSNLGPTSSNLVANITAKHRHLPRRQQPGDERAGARRRRDRLRQRPRPAHQPGERGNCRFRAWPRRAAFPKNKCASWSSKTPAAATSAFSASRG